MSAIPPTATWQDAKNVDARAKAPSQVVTVGRIVHFADGGGHPQAAHVVWVNPLILRVMVPDGGDFEVTRPPHAESLTPGHWSWPPRV